MGERVWRHWSEWGWGLELAGGMAQVTVLGHDLVVASHGGQIKNCGDTSVHDH